jgi:tRNA pseudouridine38-40 synthase
MLAKVRELFTIYEGTHNYHNFTAGKDSDEPDGNRYIKSITVTYK